MPKFVAICPSYFPGVSSVFRNGKSLGLWDSVHIDVEGKIPEHDYLILGAWDNSYRDLIDKYKCIIYITSTFGQMEFSLSKVEIEQLMYIIELRKLKKIQHILCGYPDVAEFINEYTPASYCPYPFDPKPLEKYKKTVKIPNSIGIFHPNAPRKNLFNQFIAAKDYKLFTNINDKNLLSFCKDATYTGWLPQNDYYELISRLQIMLCVTFTESLSYVACESLTLGTIPIISMQIAANMNLDYGWNETIISYVDSVYNIKTFARRYIEISEEDYNALLAQKQKSFLDGNNKSLQITKSILDNFKLL